MTWSPGCQIYSTGYDNSNTEEFAFSMISFKICAYFSLKDQYSCFLFLFFQYRQKNQQAKLGNFQRTKIGKYLIDLLHDFFFQSMPNSL